MVRLVRNRLRSNRPQLTVDWLENAARESTAENQDPCHEEPARDVFGDPKRVTRTVDRASVHSKPDFALGRSFHETVSVSNFRHGSSHRNRSIREG